MNDTSLPKKKGPLNAWVYSRVQSLYALFYIRFEAASKQVSTASQLKSILDKLPHQVKRKTFLTQDVGMCQAQIYCLLGLLGSLGY